MHSFYKSVVESIIYFLAICWIRIISDSKKLNKLIKKAGSVMGTALGALDLIVQRRMLHKLMNIKNISAHKKTQNLLSPCCHLCLFLCTELVTCPSMTLLQLNPFTTLQILLELNLLTFLCIVPSNEEHKEGQSRSTIKFF